MEKGLNAAMLFNFYQRLAAISGLVYRSTWEALDYLHHNTVTLVNADELCA